MYLYTEMFGNSMCRAGLKSRGARGNFHWRAPMTHFMTSSLIKFVLLIRNVLVCFFR